MNDTYTFTAEIYRHYKANPDGFKLKWHSIQDCLAWTIQFHKSDDRPLSVLAREERGRGNRWKRRAGWALKGLFDIGACGCGYSPCSHRAWLELYDGPFHWYEAPEA